MSTQVIAAHVVAEPAWLHNILGATLVFNLVDAVLTLCVVTMGEAGEANPFMAVALSMGPLAFMLLKLSLVSCGVFVLWSNRTRRLAVAGSVAVFLVYLGVMAMHLESLQIMADRLA